MQDGHKAQFATQLVYPEFQQGFRDSLKEDTEHEGFVSQDDGVELMGQGKYDMEVGNGEEFGFSCLKPSLSGYLLTFGAVSITAGIIDATLSAAMIAAMETTAKFGRAAVNKVR